jgi:hypothetical protein
MIDHLVYGVPDLAAAVATIADLTGVRAALGGSHPGRGTHNALLALGPRRYLEIIALDPRQHEASALLFPELPGLTVPRLLAWAVAVTSIDGAAERLAGANLRPLGPLAGARTRSDGRRLSWQTLRVAPPSPALLPFFIAWDAGVVHPADDAPQGCALLSLTIAHPSPDALRSALGDIAGAVTITAAPGPRLTASLDTPRGQVVLG